MKCDKCSQKISIFSKDVNKAGKVKTCSVCGSKYVLYMDKKHILMWALPAFLVYSLLLTPILSLVGVNKSIALGVTLMTLVLTSYKAKLIKKDK